MLIKTQKELKLAVTGLRRELKARYGAQAPSHTQCLELMARALGKASYAALLVGLPEVEKPPVVEDLPQYPLKNRFGEFDLVEEGQSGVLRLGDSFEELSGTVEDILHCVASVAEVTRDTSGTLDLAYEGSTEVNWDGQVTRVNAHGESLWEDGDGNVVSEAACVMVPEDFRGPDDEDTAYDLPNRESLLDAYLAYAEEHKLMGQLAAELPKDKLASPTLQAIAQVLGFSLHLGEYVSLEGLARVRNR